MNNEQIETLTAGNIKSAMKAAGASSHDLWMLPRNQIRLIDGFNVREAGDPDYQAHIQWLAASIEENGFYKDRPLAGYVGKEGDEDVIFLTDGHSRLAAVDQLIEKGIEIGQLPVVVKPRGTSVEDLLVAMYTSNGGKPLTPYETGVLCKRLMGLGWDDKTISKRLGLKSVQYVNDLLDLVGASPEIRKMVTQGEVSATMAIKAMKEHGAKAAPTLKKAVDKAREQGKTRATPKHMKDPAQQKPAAQSAGNGEGPGQKDTDGALRDVKQPANQALLFEAAAFLEGKQQMDQGRALQAAVMIRQFVRAIAGGAEAGD